MNKYLVIYEIEGELMEPVIETAIQIFNRMEMSDCYDIEIVSLKHLRSYKNKDEFRLDMHAFMPCQFKGTWHDPKDPLRMEIFEMFGECRTLDVGYAEDH